MFQCSGLVLLTVPISNGENNRHIGLRVKKILSLLCYINKSIMQEPYYAVGLGSGGHS